MHKYNNHSPWRDISAVSARGIVCILLLHSGLLATCRWVFAANSSPALVSEAEFFVDIPPVDTVTRLPQPKSETPAAITIIDREMIEASGARSLPDVFRLVPGMQIAHNSGAETTVTYHGLSDRYARRMQVLVDGRSVYGAWQRSVVWPTINIALEDIDRIVVTRGPNTVAYGANAFFATINIITLHAAQNKGTALKLTGGNNDIRDGFARYAQDFDHGSVRVSAGYNSDDGLDGFTNRYRTRMFNLRSDLQPNTRDNIMLQYGIGETRVQLGDNSILFPNDTTGGTDSHYELLRWTRNLANDDELGVILYHNFLTIDARQVTDPLPLPPPIGTTQVPIEILGGENRYDLEFHHSLAPWDAWRFVWGFGVSEDNSHSDYYYSSSATFINRSRRLFANAEWKPWVDTIVNTGFMWENTDLSGTDLSPRIALNYHLNDKHTIRAAWSKAIRTPSLFEENGDVRFTYQSLLINQIYLNPGGLGSEKLTSYEIGYLALAALPNTSVDVRLYRDEISNYINLVSLPSADLTDNVTLSYRNEGEIDINGLDVEIAYWPNRDTRIVLTNSWMYTDVSGISPDTVYRNDQLEDTVPAYSGSLLAMRRLTGNWHASLGFYWVGSMLWMRQLTSAGNNEQALDNYTQLDLRLSHQFRLSDSRANLAFIIQNIGGEYTDFTPGQYFNTRGFVTFQLDFN